MAGEPTGLTAAKRRAREDPQAKLPPGPGMAAEEVAAHQIARIQAALVQLVAEQGFQGLKVRDLVRSAGVSTRAFYEHFGSKEECFLRTYELIAMRATRRIIRSQASESDWRRRPRLVFAEFARLVEASPDHAQLTLVEAYGVGPTALEAARRTERTFEGMLTEAFARPPGGVSVPPLLIEGMVAGGAGVARARLRAGRTAGLSDSIEEMMRWAMSYPDEMAQRLVDLDGESVWRNTMLDPSLGGGTERLATGDRALILTALAKLVVDGGYAGLTAARVRAAAGVSRKSFEAHFDGLEECYVAALELHAAEAFAQVSRAQAATSSWPGGVYRAIAVLCECIAGDAFLAAACLGEDVPLGPVGLRARRRLIGAVVEQLSADVPRRSRPSELAAEATAAAVWSVFHRHVVREWALRREIAATLSYLALAPAPPSPRSTPSKPASKAGTPANFVSDLHAGDSRATN